MELTDVNFWEHFWATTKLPSTIDPGFAYDRCLAATLKSHLAGVTGEVLEVGCAPGKWLHFLAKELGLKPSGIEYSEAGMKATVKNFQLLGLTDAGSIRAGDFFQITPDKQFDVVMSFGFIEHFTDVDAVVERHLRWVKPGGILVLGVPNMRWIYAAAQRILNQEILDKHNTSIMNLDYFAHLERQFGLSSLFTGYIGSFEPALPIPKPKIENPWQFIVKGIIWVARRVRKIRFFDRMNHRMFSSFILAIYRTKPE
jgi:SAM-dependent methyltransferase